MINENVSFQTVEYMQQRIKELSAEKLQLKMDAASIAAEERDKIVAWLRAQNRLASLDLEQILANDIEAGEHLK